MAKDRVWAYNEPDILLPVEKTETEILYGYYDFWSALMKEKGKHDQISRENYLNDWVAAHRAWEVKRPRRWGDVTYLVLGGICAPFIYIVSLFLNALSFLKWSFNDKADDVDDDGVVGRSWESGMKNFFGLLDGLYYKNFLELLEGDRLGHRMRGFWHAWIREYPKRASKLGSLSFATLLVVAVIGWIE